MAKRKIAPNSVSPKFTITQQELLELRILQDGLAQTETACDIRLAGIAIKLENGAIVEPGAYQLVDGRVEVRS